MANWYHVTFSEKTKGKRKTAHRLLLQRDSHIINGGFLRRKTDNCPPGVFLPRTVPPGHSLFHAFSKIWDITPPVNDYEKQTDGTDRHAYAAHLTRQLKQMLTHGSKLDIAIKRQVSKQSWYAYFNEMKLITYSHRQWSQSKFIFGRWGDFYWVDSRIQIKHSRPGIFYWGGGDRPLASPGIDATRHRLSKLCCDSRVKPTCSLHEESTYVKENQMEIVLHG